MSMVGTFRPGPVARAQLARPGLVVLVGRQGR